MPGATSGKHQRGFPPLRKHAGAHVSTGPKAIRPAINAWNADFLESEYARFRLDPASVPGDVAAFFRGFELGLSRPVPQPLTDGEAARAGLPTPSVASEGLDHFHLAVEDLIRAYRTWGHLGAKLDPLERARPRPPELSLVHYGLDQADLTRPIRSAVAGLPPGATLGDLVARLEAIYCGTTAFEIMHVPSRDERAWLLERIESPREPLPPERRVRILHQLLHAEEFEKFLGKRYPSEKRFSVEGSESVIPLLDHLLERASELGVEEVVLGMAHRGRLTVLNTILGMSYEQIFTEFEDMAPEAWAGDGGDVKYHRGYSGERRFGNGRTLRLSLSSNPSHLEAVDPVVEGRCRGKQRLRGDLQRTRVVPLLIHGDAAIMGQGVVAETLNLASLEGYTTGGTVHVVINNMIGFTTPPEDGRSSTYCTDGAKVIGAPVFHVNGEDPEAVVWVARLAIEFRQRFRRDVFVDLYCYRKYGHNEQDEATYTQPILYRLIRNKPGVLKVYAERLLAEGVISDSDMAEIRRRLDEALERAQAAARQTPHDPIIEPGGAKWKGFTSRYSHEPVETGVPLAMLEEVCAALGRVPEGFHLHPKLKSLLAARANLPKTGVISYADAESLAFGTLLLEGTAVRLSGQDCRRGTFSHRHAVLRDVETGQPYIPLNGMREVGKPGTDTPPGSIAGDGRPRQAEFCVYDSPLSEYAVLGFEYGYSLADPDMLVCWEAQFGDFVNGAQIVVDQFLSSAECKWERWSGLVLLLPHGQEGMGPEHSSARVERFLQLCANDNMQVTCPTTGAQIFHLLRRQVRRNFRKPLVVLSPKSLLRLPTSRIDELTRGHFEEVLDDPLFAREGRDRSRVQRVLLCMGKVYFELHERRQRLGRDDIALVRIEQLYPLHDRLLAEVLGRYPRQASLAWVQEEPRNGGAYLYLADVFRQRFGIAALEYIGREASPAPAVGSRRLDQIQREQVVARAVGSLPDDQNRPGDARPRTGAKKSAPAR